jgi:hypothetical protein
MNSMTGDGPGREQIIESNLLFTELLQGRLAQLPREIGARHPDLQKIILRELISMNHLQKLLKNDLEDRL